ncbi:hypothetical protein ACROYT_G006679 [Oculina patagonica]
MAFLSIWMLAILSAVLTTDNAIAPNPVYGNNQQPRVQSRGNQVLRNPSLRLGPPMVKNAPSQNFNSAPSLPNQQSVHDVIKPAAQQHLPQNKPEKLNQSQQPSQTAIPPARQTTQADQNKPAAKNEDENNNNNNNNCCGLAVVVSHVAAVSLAVVVIKTSVITTNTITTVACITIVVCITFITSLMNALAPVHSPVAVDVSRCVAADVLSLAAAAAVVEAVAVVDVDFRILSATAVLDPVAALHHVAVD